MILVGMALALQGSIVLVQILLEFLALLVTTALREEIHSL
jgi:hypothetical protein